MIRGDVYFSDLPQVIGSEQGGFRPVLIIQNDKGNFFSGTVVVACITKRNKKHLPTHVFLPRKLGFEYDSVVMAEQVKTIDKSRLGNFVCHIPDKYMEMVDKSLKVSFGITEKEKKNMEQLQIFGNPEFGEIRATLINDEPYFCLKDVCEVLEIKNISDCKKRLNPKGVGTTEILTRGGRQQANFINESNLYKVIFQSRKESAERFTDWVTSEVLPAIRKTGSYQLSSNPIEQIKLIAGGIVQMDERLTRLESTMTLDYAQQQSITKAVNKAVTKVLGGKDSNAYHEVGKKVFAECNRDIKDFFCVNARNNIPRAKFQNAMDYIEKWTPSTNTKLLIKECNAQLYMQ